MEQDQGPPASGAAEPAGSRLAAPPEAAADLLRSAILAALGVGTVLVLGPADRLYFASEGLTPFKVRAISVAFLVAVAGVVACLVHLLHALGAALARLARGRALRPSRVAIGAIPLALTLLAHGLANSWLWRLYRAAVGK